MGARPDGVVGPRRVPSTTPECCPEYPNDPAAQGAPCILSSLVVAELYAGVRGEAEQAALDSFVALFRIVPVSGDIAKAGGLSNRDYGTSHAAFLKTT